MLSGRRCYPDLKFGLIKIYCIQKEKERRKSKFIEKPKKYQRIEIPKKSNPILRKNPSKVIQKMVIIKNPQYLIHRNHQKKIKIHIIYAI